MSSRTDTTDPYAAAIADLEAQAAAIKVTLDTLKRMQALSRRGEHASIEHVAPPEMIPPNSAATKQVSNLLFLEGEELGDAAVQQLETANCAMTSRDISAALARAGVQFTTRDPAYSVLAVLKRRLKRGTPDVVLTGYGKWALRKWFSDDEVAELERKWGGLGGRDRQAHAQKTSVGVREVMASGKSWGKRRTVTAELMAKTYDAMRRGRPKYKAAEEAEIKLPTFYWYWRRFKMEEWRPGLPWPPQRREVELEGPIPQELWAAWLPDKGVNGHAKDNEPQLTLRPAE